MNQLSKRTDRLNADDDAKKRVFVLRAQLMDFLKNRMSRRELLKAGGLTGLSLSALWVLACQPAAPAPTPTKPTAVGPTPAPEAKIGKHLIGKLEGPETITDPAKFPKAFKEAPALAELVKAGKLPAVKERIGDDPLVVKPVHEIGKYGGTWRRGFTGPGDWFGIARQAAHDPLFFWDYTGTKLVPNTAKGWEVSEDGRTTTVFLRRGMKWSDGQPFTADDFMFWYQDLYQNKELVPTPTAFLAPMGKHGTIEKVDTYTVRFKFPEPYYIFPEVPTVDNPLAGHATKGMVGMGLYSPAHYLKQFHPKYVSKEELDKKVAEAKMDNWVSLFKFKNDWKLNPEVPALTPWKTVSPANTPTFTLERNPYSIWVDIEGNQLPYIDKVVNTLAENLEVLNLRAIAGEYDYQARHVDIQKLPVFLANQAKGGYKVHLDPGGIGADLALWFNLSYEGDAEIAKWFNTADFRRALSLGIERDQLNETFWLGVGVPGSIVSADENPQNPGPEYRKMWSTYDPKKANELLDKIGLDKKDAAGYRLRTDGKGRLRIEAQTWLGLLPSTQICEMIREHWKKIGIDLLVQELERSLAGRRRDANEHQIHIESTWDTEHILIMLAEALFPSRSQSPLGPLYGTWYDSGGAKGKEPPPRVRAAIDAYQKARAGRTAKERNDLAKEVWKINIDEQWCIGTVGLSPATTGTRIVKTNMGNIPARILNSGGFKTPLPSVPETFFWKS